MVKPLSFKSVPQVFFTFLSTLVDAFPADSRVQKSPFVYTRALTPAATTHTFVLQSNSIER